MRSTLYQQAPRDLVDRPKQGFGVAIATWLAGWLSRGSVKESIDILRDKMPWLNVRWLDDELHAFAGHTLGKNRLWLVHVLGQWVERWV